MTMECVQFIIYLFSIVFILYFV